LERGGKEQKKKTNQNQIQRKQIEQTKEKPPENHTTADTSSSLSPQ